MFNCIVLVSFFLGTWLAFGVIYGIIKKSVKKKLPKGSIIIEQIPNDKKPAPPSDKTTKIMAIFAISGPFIVLPFIVITCLLGFWTLLIPFLTINLPDFFNWIGLFGLLGCYGWDLAIFRYNINYTVLTMPLKGKYVLATGGPYKWVRHPSYAEKFFGLILIFLMTGLWLSLIFLIGFFWIPKQAKAEESLMLKLFGEQYQKYLDKTGCFFPKLRNISLK